MMKVEVVKRFFRSDLFLGFTSQAFRRGAPCENGGDSTPKGFLPQ